MLDSHKKEYLHFILFIQSLKNFSIYAYNFYKGLKE